MATDRNTIADDLLRGASEISIFLYGDDSEQNRKRVYHIGDLGIFPLFRMGSILCARKSTLVTCIEDREKAAMARFPNGGKVA